MSIFVVILSLVLLITLHELGHFLFAKKFDVKVHEFGIGIPPRVIGKKIGETIYSLNLLPLGGFVRMLGEDEKVKEERSFSEKPIWQRAIILVAGVASFWIIAILIFAFVSFGWGITRIEVAEGDLGGQFFITEHANQRDLLKTLISGEEITVNNETINEENIDNYLTQEGNQSTIKTDQRSVTVEHIGGFMGSLRFGFSYPVYITRVQGTGIGMAIKGAVTGEGLPEGMEFGGPVMIGGMATDALERGLADYLMFVGMIATILAFMNILPIPALDGGRLMFLAIEKVKGSPIPARVEKAVNAAFFLLLIILMVAITVRDIYNIL